MEMKSLVLLALLFLPAQGILIIGFEPKEYCVVEDGYVNICIVALDGIVGLEHVEPFDLTIDRGMF